MHRKTSAVYKMILPDGRRLPLGKIDSLEQVWGKGRVSMQHSKEDGDNHIVHLAQMNDDVKAKLDSLHNVAVEQLNGMIGHPAPGFT